MSRLDSERESGESLKRMWQERRSGSSLIQDQRLIKPSSSPLYNLGFNPNRRSCSQLLLRPGGDDLQVASVIPPVTVVLEGRSICHRISLHKHGSYQSLARALNHMFDPQDHHSAAADVDLSNAVPGHIIAYEDMENDLLLVGDLNWKDFVRVAKRIRILPVKPKSKRLKTEFTN